MFAFLTHDQAFAHFFVTRILKSFKYKNIQNVEIVKPLKQDPLSRESLTHEPIPEGEVGEVLKQGKASRYKLFPDNAYCVNCVTIGIHVFSFHFF